MSTGKGIAIAAFPMGFGAVMVFVCALVATIFVTEAD